MRAFVVAVLFAAGCSQVLGIDHFTNGSGSIDAPADVTDASETDAPASTIDAPASTIDASEIDAATIDASEIDAAMIDAKPIDAGAPDAKPIDAGTPDGGVVAVCGNGILDPGEQCDNGASNGDDADCTASCELNVCGDGFVDTKGPSHVEQCDNGFANTNAKSCAYGMPSCTLCSTTCQTVSASGPYCGDGIVQASDGEVCDMGAQNGAMSCSGRIGAIPECLNNCTTQSTLNCGG